MIFLSSFLISITTTIALVPIIRQMAIHLDLGVDLPHERKIHKVPVPRIGGISMAIGAFIPVALWVAMGKFAFAIFLSTGLIVLFGVIDDFINLNFKIKFIVQILAALIIIFLGGVKIHYLGLLLPEGVSLPDAIAIPLTILVIVGVTDAINLIDGLDGLAGGIAMLSFICIGYLAYFSDQDVILLFSVAVIGSILGFLRFNTHPATIFMGDGGSQMLGFLAVVLSLALTQGIFDSQPFIPSPVLPLLLLGLPVLDTLTVVVERIRKGASPFKADKRHFHHKLMRLGLFHREAVLVIYLLHSFLILSAFIFRFFTEWFLLSYYLIFSGILLFVLRKAQRNNWNFPREKFFEKSAFGTLRAINNQNLPIKISFRIVQLGVPTLFLITCFLPEKIPPLLYSSFLFLFVLIMFCWQFGREYIQILFDIVLYLFIPVIVFFSETQRAAWISEFCLFLYNGAFALVFFFVIMTLKFTRRTKGFKSTPLDYLILFIALVVPNLPDPQIQDWQLGLIAAKIIVFYFSYEVLLGEMRIHVNTIRWATVFTFFIFTFRILAGP